MKLPDEYSWLKEIGPLPRCIQEGLKLYGTTEFVGKGSNPLILEWRDELNQKGVAIKNYTDDDIAWCGLFAAIVVSRARGPEEVVKDPLWALNWSAYGVKSPRAALGDVLAFKRPSGGHVGFYIAEDEKAYHVLGGNQRNSVCITRVEKYRCRAVRRPPYHTPPISAKSYKVVASGDLSYNES